MVVSQCKFISVVLLCVFMVGCSSSPIIPVDLKQGFLSPSASHKKVAVYLDTLPEPGMYYPGASCLLCLGAAVVANANLGSHVKTLDYVELESLDKDVVKLLNASGVEAFTVNDEVDLHGLPKIEYKNIPNSARKDHSVFAAKYGATHVLILDLNTIGMQRNYSSYTPTSDPFAKLLGVVYLVDTNSNILEWYLPIDTTALADGGVWNEPEHFPGLTAAYYQNIETVRERILAPLQP